MRETEVLANARRDSLTTKCAPDHPCFERAETATELDTVIHVIDLGTHGIAQMQMFRLECKQTSQPANVAHVKRAEIERHEEHFMGINHDRVRFIPAVGDPFALG